MTTATQREMVKRAHVRERIMANKGNKSEFHLVYAKGRKKKNPNWFLAFDLKTFCFCTLLYIILCGIQFFFSISLSLTVCTFFCFSPNW